MCALLLPPGRASPSFQDVKWVAASLREAQPGSASATMMETAEPPAQRFPAADRRSPLFACPLWKEEAGEAGARAATQLPSAPSRRPGGNPRASRTPSGSPKASPAEGWGTPTVNTKVGRCEPESGGVRHGAGECARVCQCAREPGAPALLTSRR